MSTEKKNSQKSAEMNVQQSDGNPAGAPIPEVCAWSPEEIEQFVAGQITLGELEGIPKEAQYEMAQVGHTLLTEGRLAQASRVFEGLHALDPFDAYFLTALGSIAQRSGDLEDAEARYTRALEINPFGVPARAHRGEVRVLLGRVDEAVADFRRVAEEDPTGSDPAAQRAAAVARLVLGQLQEQIA